MKINNEKILADLLKKLEYQSLKYILIKPLAPIKIDKEAVDFVEELDEDGKAIYETDKVTGQVVLKMRPEKKIINTELNFQLGVVLQLPVGYEEQSYKPGDIVAYSKKTAIYFDLYKDSMLINPYDIIALKINK